jgi:hypothetical protein
MNTPHHPTFAHSEFLALILLLSGVFFRVLRVDLAPEVLPNFSPLMAAALCGALFLPGILGLVLPLVALLISDALLNLHYGVPLLSMQLLWTLPCYLITVGLGWMLRHRNASSVGLFPVLGGTLAASLLFYLTTNTGCWFANPAYPQSLSGWVQSLTVGLPGYPPTWHFFRNSLVSDLLFATLFVVLERSLAKDRQKIAAVVA